MNTQSSRQTEPVKFRCLVVEDDLGVSEFIAHAVGKEGGTVFPCRSIESAREAVRMERFDLMILDHMLPDGTGSSFFYEMREKGISTTAIMLTGLPDIATAVGLTRNGLFDYLTKPFSYEDFAACLRRAVLRRSQKEGGFAYLGIAGRSPAMREVLRQVQQAVSHPETTVLLTGETGVGKDLTAGMVHELTFAMHSPKPPLINLNCSTLPGDMFEAELFGAERGAYTGAHQQRAGLVSAAQGGTLFLDEIAEVPLLLQSKLLQFLETRLYRRLGSAEAQRFTGRIITATNKNLEEEVQEGRFRSDLFYRLDVLSIRIPPLRERLEDLEELIDFLLEKLAEKYGRPKPLLKPSDYTLLRHYQFPGNIRELRNILERSMLQTAADAHWLQIDPVWLSKVRRNTTPAVEAGGMGGIGGLAGNGGSDRELTPLEAQEYALIRQALADENGVIRRAAARLGLTHQSLLRRLEKWPELRAQA